MRKRSTIRLSLWHKILLLLLIPVLAASAVVYFEFQNLRTIHNKIHVIEIIDDINLTILEIRRYEKNILLFNEERNVRMFYEHFDELKKSIQKMESEIISDMSKMQYKALQKNIESYDRHFSDLIASVREEHRIVEAIRPLGRAIEHGTSDKKAALDLRRYEKNFIIYKEQAAIRNVHNISKQLVKIQPALSVPVERYLASFDRLVSNEAVKEDSGNQIRNYAREIQKSVTELSKKKREDINKIIARANQSFIAVFLFLLAATVYGGYVISTRILKTVRNVGRAVQNMARDDFSYILDPSAPEEIVAFNRAFNCSVRKLEEAKVELELTLGKLEDTNRELVEKQEELVEARKMTAMRLLASEIAHEVSNPLSSLITCLGIYREELKADDPKKDEFGFMMSEAKRCQAVLRELVDFARKEPLQLKEVNPAALVNDAIKSAVKQQNGKRVRLSASLQGLPDRSVLDPVLIYQAFFNIITNAYQHTSDGGSIVIHGSTSGTDMHVSVRDSGMGIPDDVLPYIFDTFFSTRKDTGGSGLGLAITKKIIERHKGSIRVSSKPGEETVFQISLPVQAGLP
jgi:two-component system NtrC family sensor kinase